MSRDPQATITVVSGLPRSGTSMMMRMLEAGGFPLLVDNARRPDEDNPQGYFEYEPVKRTQRDCTWTSQAPGKAVKVIYKLLNHLPPDYQYSVLFMRRRIAQVVASQNAMLRRLGQHADFDNDDHRVIAILSEETSTILDWLNKQPNFAFLEVDYNQLMERDPRPVIQSVAEFVGRPLDVPAMLASIEPTLYRRQDPSVS